jgi:glucokinase
MAAYIGIDLGGTNIKGVLMSSTGEILTQHYIPTQDTGTDIDTWKKNVHKMVEYLKNHWQKPIDSIGISAPGLPNDTNRCIAFLPNRLNGIENFDWSDYLKTNTYVINDAHAALMAEVSFGIAKGLKNVVLLTLGTGVGGGLLINGQLYQGLGQMAGHLGHTVVNASDDVQSIVGMAGSLEYALGNFSILQRTHGRYESTWHLVEQYRKNDHFATYVWLKSIRTLALALASLVNTFSPQAIILAGGITLAGDALYEPLQTFMDIYEWRPAGKKTPILQAHFGDIAGAIGAASFAMSNEL